MMKIKELRDFLLVLAVLVWWFAMFLWMGRVWAGHPAEQTITEAEHMEMIEGWTR